jgi:hypothetical protein
MKIRFDEGRLIFNGGKVIRLVDPPTWLEAGGTSFNESVTYVGDDASCPTTGQILGFLTVFYPPEDYSTGYRIRVRSFTNGLVFCDDSY